MIGFQEYDDSLSELAKKYGTTGQKPDTKRDYIFFRNRGLVSTGGKLSERCLFSMTFSIQIVPKPYNAHNVCNAEGIKKRL